MIRSPQLGALLPYGLAIALALGVLYLIYSTKSSGADLEADARAVIERAMLTDKPADCTRLYTLGLLEQLSGEKGRDAVEDCRDSADGNPSAESIEIRRLEVAGSRATAAVELAGGELGGSTMRFELTKDRSWKFDRLVGVDLDPGRFLRAQKAAVIREGFSDDEAACVLAHVRRKFTVAEMERAIVNGDWGSSASGAVSCLSAATLRAQTAEAIESNLTEDDVPYSLAKCVAEEVTSNLSAARLRDLARESAADEVAALLRAAAARCQLV